MRAIRWLSRALGLLLVIFLLAILLGELLHEVRAGAVADLPHLTSVEQLLFLCLGLMLIGVVIALGHEGIGGALTLFGAVAFVAVNSIHTGAFRLGYVEPAFAIVAVLFLCCWWQDEQRGRHQLS